MSVKALQASLDRIQALNTVSNEEAQKVGAETLAAFVEHMDGDLDTLVMIARWTFILASFQKVSAKKFLNRIATDAGEAADFMEQASKATTVEALLEAMLGMPGAAEFVNELFEMVEDEDEVA